jgi:hypothetical protein
MADIDESSSSSSSSRKRTRGDESLTLVLLPDVTVSDILTYLNCEDLCRTDASCKRLQTLGLEAWSNLERTLSRSKKPTSSSSSSSKKESFIKYHQASAKAKELQDVLNHKHNAIRQLVRRRSCPKCSALPAVNSRPTTTTTTTATEHHSSCDDEYDFFCRIARCCQRKGKERQWLFEGFLPYEPTRISDTHIGPQLKMLWRTDEAYTNNDSEHDDDGIISNWEAMDHMLEFYTVAATTQTQLFRMPPLRNHGGHHELKDALFGDLVVTVLAVPRSSSSGDTSSSSSRNDEGITLAAFASRYDGNRTSYGMDYSLIHLNEEPRDPHDPNLGVQDLYFAFQLPRGGPARWLGIGLHSASVTADWSST